MDSTNSQRFKKMCDRLGYTIHPITSRINGMFHRRPDVLGVHKEGDFVLVIPKRIYGFPIAAYRDLLNCQQPDYFTCEKALLKHFYGL